MLELFIKSGMFELKFAVGDGGNASFPNWLCGPQRNAE